jgi:hypothetical protein
MNKRIFMIVIALVVDLFLLSVPGWAGMAENPEGVVETAEMEETGGIIYPGKTTVKPGIDGILDEEPWQVPPLKADFISYDPLYGEKLPYKTLVWMTYDNKNLYFAFRCYDSEPQKIKTSMTSRDNMWDDDWVGILLESLGNKQTMYGFVVNPSGIQGDLLQSTGNEQDLSPDFVWESAGKITYSGFQVEICIPLRSIRFQSGKEVKMGIIFKRKISRLSVKGSWPELKPGEGEFNFLKPVIYRKLEKPLKLEILPGITHTSNRQRLQPDQWNKSENITAFGIGVKYGITSSITADITLNPDFSQVESDAFQVEVNQRYPLFYNEKRPFFMEGADIFSFFTIPNGFLPYALHTRRIIDPAYGVKLTGTVKDFSFGLLHAGDKWPGQVQDGINPHKDKIAFFGIARGKYSLGKDNYIGLLYSGREFLEEYNRVIGADIGFRLSKNQRINASFLQSNSFGENGSPTNNSNNSPSRNFNFLYAYSTKPLEINAAFEHIGRDFRMDSAFLRRTGLDEGWASIAYNFYHDSQKIPWLKLIKSSIFFQYLHDLNTNMEDMYLDLGLVLNFIKQGHILINYYARRESWEGEVFPLNQFYLHGGMQFTKWLQMCAEITWGEKIYYEAQPAYKGKGYDPALFINLQPNNKLKQTFNFYHSDLFKNKKKIYDVNIFFSSTTYQFNKYFFLRAVLQYNSFDKRLLTDFLASFTFIPGTVFHLGYGGLYESRKWQNNNWLYRQGDLLNIKRSFFLKASYLWRF